MRRGEAGLLFEVNHFEELGVVWIGSDVEKVESAGKESRSVDVASIVGEAEMMRLVALRSEIDGLYDLAVVLRVRIHVNGHHEIIVPAVRINTPDVYDPLRALEIFQKRRV